MQLDHLGAFGLKQLFGSDPSRMRAGVRSGKEDWIEWFALPVNTYGTGSA